MRDSDRPGQQQSAARGFIDHEIGRRGFVGYLIGGATLIAGADVFLGADPATAAVPSPPQPSDAVDLNDILTDATLPTANLITVTVNPDGTASFAMPRVESGQGITTSTAMMIAEELELPVDKVHVTLADARPELEFNQVTYGSNTTISTYTPFRVAAAIARQALLEAAAIELGDNLNNLVAKAGHVLGSGGRSLSYGDLASRAASRKTRKVKAPDLKQPTDFSVIGKPHDRVDARAAVTGTKTYTLDVDVPDAWPTMICRAPTINGSVKRVNNADAIRGMPGISDVVTIPTGVAVRGRTFGQCIDAVRALDVTWGPGTVDGESDDTILAKLRKAQLPFAVPKLPVLAKTMEQEFVFSWKSNSALEPQTAIADVRDGKAEIWSSMQAPILTAQRIAKALRMPTSAVTAHCTQGGGAFGRRMFVNAPLEAAQISQKVGKPVRLMWHRADEFRYGRTHPMCISTVRTSYLGGNVLAFEQRHTSVATDYTMALGEILTQEAARLPPAGLGNELEFSQTVFETTTNVPYNFGAVDQALNEIMEYDTFPTGSNRNLYNPDVVAAVEVMVDRLARAMGKDPYRFRRAFLKDDRARAVLDAVARKGSWGRSMPAGTAQGIALHTEYKGATAALVEIDARPGAVNRKVKDGVTGPRVTKVVFAIDAGLPINPRGLEAQMMGGTMDAIGQVLTESLHLRDGHFLEGSWDDYFYTRQWNTPPELEVIVMPPTTGRPGGAGEFGVAASKAATANALARATGKRSAYFPVNHQDPLAFDPYPFEPSVPQSPTDGLDYAY
ncbi:MAG: molybdopterin cofactor-binding domain-containing protein [Marmoricola sp.]